MITSVQSSPLDADNRLPRCNLTVTQVFLAYSRLLRDQLRVNHNLLNFSDSSLAPPRLSLAKFLSSVVTQLLHLSQLARLFQVQMSFPSLSKDSSRPIKSQPPPTESYQHQKWMWSAIEATIGKIINLSQAYPVFWMCFNQGSWSKRRHPTHSTAKSISAKVLSTETSRTKLRGHSKPEMLCLPKWSGVMSPRRTK